jgi:hypothetical protein
MESFFFFGTTNLVVLNFVTYLLLGNFERRNKRHDENYSHFKTKSKADL